MYVDCQRCPARPLACDGCMMQVLFGAPNCENPGAEDGGTVTGTALSPDVEIDAAIDVLAKAAMISNAAALSARNGKTTRQGAVSGTRLRILRAG